MDLYYAPEFVNGNYFLPHDEARHLIKVMRQGIGSQIQVTDGKGTIYNARVLNDNIKKCLVEIIEQQTNYEKRNFYLHLAVAPTKNTDRFEWFVEKAIEIGVDEITPIICDRSERKHINIDRLNRIAVSAIKQSVKAYFPIINEAVKFSNFIKYNINSQKCIAYCNHSNRMALNNCYKAGSNVLVLIGPEGDFTPSEITEAFDNNYIPITLGKSRLRTETAAIAACNIINFLNE